MTHSQTVCSVENFTPVLENTVKIELVGEFVCLYKEMLDVLAFHFPQNTMILSVQLLIYSSVGKYVDYAVCIDPLIPLLKIPMFFVSGLN